MRIRARQHRRRQERITLNLASMIDVTFLLLMYFLQTMIIAPQEDALNPALSVRQQDAAGDRSDFQPQVVAVVRSGNGATYRLGSRLIDSQAALTDALRPLHKESGIFIRVDNDVLVDHAMAALQAAHDAGFEKVTYDPPE